MASKIKVDQIEGSTASTITLPSGQTLDLSSGSLTLPDGAVDLSTAKVTGTIPVSKGGTGLTSLGTAGQALKVNSGATGLEFGAVAGGKVLQVLQTLKTDTFSWSTQQTWTDITGLSVSITPSSASSKILIFSNVNGQGAAGATRIVLRMMRDSTPIGIGDTAGSRVRTGFSKIYDGSGRSLRGASATVLDTPSTTSAITYKIQGYNTEGSQTVYINRSEVDGDDASYDRTASNITVMEIGA